MTNEVNLPAISTTTLSPIDEISSALGIPRTVLAGDDEIARAWNQLPRLLTLIPQEQLTVHQARMCIAVRAGLFDSAINYAWNSAILALRGKVRGFGLNVVPQVIQKPFDESTLDDLKDAELLELCLSLNLIVEDAYFFLDQCRDIRNNFSAAHPAVGTIDDTEFVSFLNRVIRYALVTTSNPTGVNMQGLITALKQSRFTDDQEKEWLDRVDSTHDAQRQIIVSMLHGLYCDPDSSEESRLNALDICTKLAPKFTPAIRSELLDRHSDYVADGQSDRQKASQQFFENLTMLSLLSEVERHAILSRACKRLYGVHQGWDNFYNEPPFAERLLELSRQGAVPESTRAEFVNTVVACASGNQYGVSTTALPHYETMIKDFSPREILLMLEFPGGKLIAGRRIRSNAGILNRYKKLVSLLDEKSIPPSHQKLWEQWRSP